jgi:hypothetical protein
MGLAIPLTQLIALWSQCCAMQEREGSREELC